MQPGQDPNGIAICICFWNGNDCAELLMAKGGELYKAKPPTPGRVADAARLKRIFEGNFDAGYVFGPGRASTCTFEERFDQHVTRIRDGMALPHFQF